MSNIPTKAFRWPDTEDAATCLPRAKAPQEKLDSEAPTASFNALAFVMDYESGNLDHDEIVDGFQHLLDTGIIYHLQGSYHRALLELIRRGYVTEKK